ncbi:MAG TPA: flagellar motor protein MotB [Solirubrobacteraceae bacterium]|jgi:chemotaxis protein MotB
MSATATRGRRRHADHEEEEHENEERWLVSFADMMTLLFCLFMVLFAISSVNTSKFESLKRSLKESFNGKVITGGHAVMETGETEQTERAVPDPPVQSIMPIDAVRAQLDTAKARVSADDALKEEESFRRLKARIDEDARSLGLADKVRTEIRERGLVVRLLTDGVFFDSGRADLKPAALPILARLGDVIGGERRHPVVVEGYTDDQPISSGLYPSNWELSGGRAASVVRRMLAAGVSRGRISMAGYAERHPVASNATPDGRSRNRRVEVVLTRLNSTPTQGGTAP